MNQVHIMEVTHGEQNLAEHFPHDVIRKEIPRHDVLTAQEVKQCPAWHVLEHVVLEQLALQVAVIMHKVDMLNLMIFADLQGKKFLFLLRGWLGLVEYFDKDRGIIVPFPGAGLQWIIWEVVVRDNGASFDRMSGHTSLKNNYGWW